MLTGELRNKVDSLWEIFWTGGLANPLDVIEQMGYVPDLNARSLTMRDSKLIGVVVPQTEPGDRLMFQNSFYSEVLGSIEYYARQQGYHILISATDANESYLTLAKKRNLDGIIVIGMYPNDFYQQMKKTQIPIVLIDSYCNDHYYHNIRIDDAYGSYLATRYMLENGHEHVAFFAGQMKENGVMKKRLLGYQQALSEFEIPFRSEYIFEGQIDYNSGIDLANKLMIPACPQRVLWQLLTSWQSVQPRASLKQASMCRMTIPSLALTTWRLPNT